MAKFDFLEKYKKGFVGAKYKPTDLIPLRYTENLISTMERIHVDLQKNLKNINIPNKDKQLNLIGLYIRQLSNLRVKDHVWFAKRTSQIMDMIRNLLEKSKAFSLKGHE